MKPEYVDPFVDSVIDLFSTMLGGEVKRDENAHADERRNGEMVTGIIELSGSATGTVVIAFPDEVALRIVGRMFGMEFNEVDDTVLDAIGEVTNIIAGGAKSKFDVGDGPPINLGLPTVVRGSEYLVDLPADAVWANVPFGSSIGSFFMRVTLAIKGS